MALGGQTVEDLPEPGTPEAPPVVPPLEANVELASSSSSDEGSSQQAGVERVSVPEPPLARPQEGEAAVSPAASAAATNGTTGGGSGYQEKWATYVQLLKDLGVYTEKSDDGLPMTEIGAMKRAALEAARVRPDVIFSLDSEKVATFAKAYVPPTREVRQAISDRKCVNAMKRLNATFVTKSELPIGEGGSATFLDLSRTTFALQLDLQTGNPVDPALEAAGDELLGDIIQVYKADPTPEALAKSAEADILRREQEATSLAIKQEKRAARGYGARETGVYGRREGAFGQDSYGQGGFNGNPNVKPGDWSCEECGGHNFARNTSCFKCRAPKPEGASGPSFGGPSQSFGQPRQFDRQPRQFGAQDFSPAGQEVRPGDWACPACSAHNFSSKYECFKCGLPKPDDAMAPQGGQAPPRQSFGGPRDFGGGERDFGRQFGGMRQQGGEGMNPHPSKPGDWGCTECGANNFARRQDCYKCSAPRSPNAVVVEGDQDFGGGGFGGRPSFGRGPPRFARGGDEFGQQRMAPEKRPGDWDCPACRAHNFKTKTECFKCGIPKPPGSEYQGDGGGRFGGGGGGRTGRSYSGYNRGPASGGRGGGGGGNSEWYGGGGASGGAAPPPADMDW